MKVLVDTNVVFDAVYSPAELLEVTQARHRTDDASDKGR